MGPSSAGRGWGNTTTIERVGKPRADSYLQKRQRPLNYAVVPRSAEWDRLVPGGGGEIPLQ